MGAKEMLSLYDAMVRLFAASMPNFELPTQVLAHILNIPRGTIQRVLATCPLPNGIELTRGGHRGLEWFLTQLTYTHPSIRAGLVQEIKQESVWVEYGLTLNPNPAELVREVEKVLENIKVLKGTTKKKESIIKNGDPKAYRVIWFAKDVINGEWYHTIQTAIGENRIARSPIKKGQEESVIHPIPSTPRPGVPQFDKYSLINFITDVQGLITSKDHYLAVIKQMENKINREYPALISQKEREKAEAEREAEVLRDRVKILEKLDIQQKEEIKNLKRHPKFAGFIKPGEDGRSVPGARKLAP